MRLKDNGALTVEVVLVLPLLFVLIFVSIEITRFARYRQAITLLLSEAAKSTYKSCSDFLEENMNAGGGFATDFIATQKRTELCLNDVMFRGASSGFAPFAAGLAPYLNLPQINLTVSVYSYSVPVISGSVNPLNLLGRYQTSVSHPSQFSIDGSGRSLTGPLEIPETFTKAHQRFVIVEGYFEFDGPFSRALNAGSLPTGVVYDFAIQ